MTRRLFPISLQGQIACVERAIRRRRRLYPRWVNEGRMTQTKADEQIRTIAAVLETPLKLQRRDRGDQGSATGGPQP